MSSNIVIDGVSTIDTGSSGAALFNINVESIAEVKILESGYQAEYGLPSGLQVLAVTKSGTNRSAAPSTTCGAIPSGMPTAMPNVLNNVAKTMSKAQDIGSSISGPIGKPSGHNKLFFFFAEEFNPATAGGTQQTFRLRTALCAARGFFADHGQPREPVSVHRRYRSRAACPPQLRPAIRSRICRDGGVSEGSGKQAHPLD